ncbi:MAG TPA: ECF-type sigma factor [Rudaea sp.]|nr:ECF-type sigma factor [Rudaea sp.]
MGAGEVTGLIESAGKGDAAALQALFARVYDELKQLARKQLAASSGNTLNTTALVHEAYLKLAQPDARHLHGRVHFFALAAKAMRQIVIDHARARLAEKRGGGQTQMVEFDQAMGVADNAMAADELLRVDSALASLETEEPKLAQLVEWRFFAGLGVAEIATLQNTSERTVNRDWRLAKARLYGMLHPEA